MRQSPIEVIVFDAVGTLIYPEPSVGAIYAAVGRRFGSNLDLEEVERRFRHVFSDEEAVACAGDRRTSEDIEYERWRRIVGRVLCDAYDVDGCFSQLFAHFAKAESWRVFPDVATALTDLRSSGRRFGIASNFDFRLFDIIRSLDATRHVHFVLASSQIGFRKPHRAFFEAIVSHAAVEPARILYVGDQLQNDVAAARAAGLRSLLLDRTQAKSHQGISSLSELSHCIYLTT